MKKILNKITLKLILSLVRTLRPVEYAIFRLLGPRKKNVAYYVFFVVEYEFNISFLKKTCRKFLLTIN